MSCRVQVGPGQIRPGNRVVRVQLQRLAQICDAPHDIFPRQSFDHVARLQCQSVRLCVLPPTARCLRNLRFDLPARLGVRFLPQERGEQSFSTVFAMSPAREDVVQRSS